MIGRILSGTFAGLLLAGSFAWGVTLAFAGEPFAAAVAGLVAGALGAAYSALAFAKGVHAPQLSSVAGYALDMTWSLPNTAAALFVWLPLSLALSGGLLPADRNTRRSGVFVCEKNPRGGGYRATTIGTVIAGGWDAHEETHVWQARIFGPFYLPAYALCWLLVFALRAAGGRLRNIEREAYARVCFEDWAYWGTEPGTAVYRWRGWVAGFFLSLLFVLLMLCIPLGVIAGTPPLTILGTSGVVAYAAVRAYTPPSVRP